ncbi:MAG: hypothetical protein KAH72_06995 [Flavobacteriaceae bacterium]|nr:hypothetical protein [Flavobacteriaceae bacterium]
MENLTSQEQTNAQVLSVKDWAITIFITSLPLIGLVMLLVWAFSDDTNINKKNWAKGNLLIMLIILAIMFAFLFLFGGIALMSNIFD